VNAEIAIVNGEIGHREQRDRDGEHPDRVIVNTWVAPGS